MRNLTSYFAVLMSGASATVALPDVVTAGDPPWPHDRRTPPSGQRRGRRNGGPRRRRAAAALTLALAATGLVTGTMGTAAAEETAGKKAAAAGSAERAAQAAEQGFVGKMERALADRLALRADAAVDTVYLVRGPGDQRARGDLEGIARAMAAAQEGLVAALEASGQRVKYRARYAPLVVASGAGAAVRAMGARGDVERIYVERTHRPRLSVTKVVTQATTVHGRGINGTGVRVGIVEAGRVGSHPNLPAARRVLCRPTAATAASLHKTEAAGAIQSNNATNTGQAPQVTLVDGIGANLTDAEMMAATDCVIGQGAVAVSMSFGSDTDGAFDAMARYVDATAHNTGRTLVVAVSNNCRLRMGSPEIAFNDLSVGSFSDRNTVAGGDDVHSCSVPEAHSAFLDPPSPNNDREQPDVVAPGHLVRTTVPGGGFADAIGTSFAAPHVAGLAGLLHDRSTTFLTQGERLRAIVMASARKNVEGASRLSERDGAGAIQDAAADRVLLNAQSFFVETPGGTAGFPVSRTFAASAGQRVRVALVWSHKHPAGATLTQPTTDLDLVVQQPGGAVVATSSSFDNTFEIVEFTAPVAGTYTARVDNFRASAGAESIGLAVSRLNQ